MNTSGGRRPSLTTTAPAALALTFILASCVPLPTDPASEADPGTTTEAGQSQDPGSSPAVSNDTILIDASRDGGVWWYPQGRDGFDAYAPHQGKALADCFRRQGYPVLELGRGTEITDALLDRFDKVIRAGLYGSYSVSELRAYERYMARPGAHLVLVPHFLWDGRRDALSERIGLVMEGEYRGVMSATTPNPLTAGVQPLSYGPGSAMSNVSTASVTPLAALEDGRVVMGLVDDHPAEILFLGDLRLLEVVPGALVANLLDWLG